jgi:hypothetical protein
MGATRFAQTGQGWLSTQDLAKRINDKYPDASPMAKFKAMEMGMKLLNQDSQNQFNQMTRLIQLQQHGETQQETAAHHREMEEIARTKADPQYAVDKAARIAAAKAPITSLTGILKDADKTYSNTKAQHDTLVANTNTLIDLAKKVGITGNITVDTWLTNAKDKLGLTSADVASYRSQLNAVLMEAASIANVRAGVITEGQRKEAERALMPGAILPPGLLQGLATTWKKDATNKEQAYLKRRKQITKQIEALGKGEELPEEAPEKEAPAAAAGAPAANDPLGMNK